MTIRVDVLVKDRLRLPSRNPPFSAAVAILLALTLEKLECHGIEKRSG
jgi:hypothetical protein